MKILPSTFDGLIDYAGLFPPAKAPFKEALRRYLTAADGPDAAMLGPFVLGGANLSNWLETHEASGSAVSLVPTADRCEQEVAIALSAAEHGALRLEAVELPPLPLERWERMLLSLQGRVKVYCEIPWAEDIGPKLDFVQVHRAHAKLRTGGVLAEAFPPPERLAELIEVFVRAKVAFKATAGLHHAVRGAYALTYEQDATKAAMHGFLNLLAAAVSADNGASRARLTEILRSESAADFRIAGDRATFLNQTFDAGQLKRARAQVFHSFGSCSFDEPVQELKSLGILS